MNTQYFKKVLEHFGSQTKLAEALDVQKCMVSLWANDKINMPIKYALKIHFLTKGKFRFFKLLDEETRSYLIKK